jgi:DegV family protein with EDD domain
VRRTAIITDSSVCLPAPVVDALGICVLPITVHLPGSDHLDGGDDLGRKVYQALENGQPVKSSEPLLADYLAAIEDCEASSAVVITPAVEFTAMQGHAVLACELASRPAVTLDSRTAAAGQGLVVLEGAEPAAAGASLETVVRAIKAAIRRVDLVALVASLGHLRHSGRVPPTSLDALDDEGDHTVFRMRSGAVRPLATAASAGAALDLIEAEWTRGGADHSRCGVFHADRPLLAEELAARLGEGEHTPSVTAFSAAMGIHTGPGVAGAAWLSTPPSGRRRI